MLSSACGAVFLNDIDDEKGGSCVSAREGGLALIAYICKIKAGKAGKAGARQAAL
jgi:hypothetical protein